MRISIIKSKYKAFFFLLIWIFIWGIISLFINKEIYLPSPFSTFSALFKLMFIKDTYITILYSTYRTLLGFSLSCFLGIVLGYFCGINKLINDLFAPLVKIIRTVPIISVIIIALIWFKDTNVPIFIAFLMSFPIVTTNTMAGIKSTDINLLQMCKVYNIKKSRIIKTVYFYSAFPYIKSAMISSLGLGWKVTSAAEVLSMPKYSIGGNLYNSKIYLEIPDLFAWTIIIVILSFIFEYLLKWILGVKYDQFD